MCVYLCALADLPVVPHPPPQVTRERIRQIEAKAIRKLRHPSRASLLADYAEGSTSVGNRKARVGHKG